MAFRNNVTRLLDAHKVAYEVLEYPPEKHSAEETAVLLGVPAHSVYKTLVVLRETSFCRETRHTSSGVGWTK